MRISPTSLLPTVLFLCFLLGTTGQALCQDKEWRPVTPAEMQLKASSVEPGADAEVIFWEVRVDDTDPSSLKEKHWIRVKIFTEKGREKYSKVDIPYAKNVSIKDIKARVIKADGTIVDLAKADIFDREIAKKDKIKVKAKSFAVPNIEPGVILEYKYQEVYESTWAHNMKMVFQHDVPIQKITYFFKPAADTKYFLYNMDQKFVKDKDSYYRATLESVPALKEEAYMPPQDAVRSWLLLYYTSNLKETTADFWSHAGYDIAQNWEIKDTLKPGKEVKAAAAQITAGVVGAEEQVKKIFEFCKTAVKNISFDPSMTDDQKKEIKPNKSTGDTYKRLQGTSVDVNELFASLTSAIGLETRLAFGGDRSEMFFNPRQAHTSFLHFSAVGVKVNDKWRYYSPGDKFVPLGLLDWTAEDSSVLLLGYKDYMTTGTSYSKPEQSEAKRTGKFKLLEDGTLEGTMRIEYTGHLANQYKLDNYKDSDNKREENLKDEVKETMSTAEVSAISIQNVTDPEKPFTYEFNVKVPNYAQKTGKRIFFQPGVFTFGTEPAFSAATRKYDIFFHHPWSENDNVEIQLPKGFELENADAPEVVGDRAGIGALKIEISIDRQQNVLVYKRRFSFGDGGHILFPSSKYEPLKSLFDSFHKSDTHSLILKQK